MKGIMIVLILFFLRIRDIVSRIPLIWLQIENSRFGVKLAFSGINLVLSAPS